MKDQNSEQDDEIVKSENLCYSSYSTAEMLQIAITSPICNDLPKSVHPNAIVTQILTEEGRKKYHQMHNPSQDFSEMDNNINDNLISSKTDMISSSQDSTVFQQLIAALNRFERGEKTNQNSETKWPEPSEETRSKYSQYGQRDNEETRSKYSQYNQRDNEETHPKYSQYNQRDNGNNHNHNINEYSQESSYNMDEQYDSNDQNNFDRNDWGGPIYPYSPIEKSEKAEKLINETNETNFSNNQENFDNEKEKKSIEIGRHRKTPLNINLISGSISTSECASPNAETSSTIPRKKRNTKTIKLDDIQIKAVLNQTSLSSIIKEFENRCISMEIQIQQLREALSEAIEVIRSEALSNDSLFQRIRRERFNSWKYILDKSDMK